MFRASTNERRGTIVSAFCYIVSAFCYTAAHAVACIQ